MATMNVSTPPMDVEKETVVGNNNRGLKKVMPKGLDEKLLKHSHDADAAMMAFEGMDGQVIELTEEKNKALLRKIDWHMMPVSNSLRH
jgi:ACS family allantoate permease-like MFS transporter